MLAKEVAAEYKLDCILRNLSKRTVKGYNNNVLKFLDFLEVDFSITEIEAIRPPHIKKYVQHLMHCGLQPTYINGILKSLRGYFKYAHAEGYIQDNPSKKVNWQKEGKVIIETFTDEEVRRMLRVYDYSSYMSARNKLILAIAFDTGARNTEICSILEEDIKNNVILIHGKGKKERHVPLTPYVKKVLLRYSRIKAQYFYGKRAQTEFLLLSRTGRPLTKEALEYIFKNAGELAGVRENLRCSPHTARHYYAQANLRNGLDVYSVSRLLGHENITITKRYLESLHDSDIIERAIDLSPLSVL